MVRNNKLVAINRWKHVSRKLDEHLQSIAYTPEYAVFRARLLAYISADGSLIVRRERKNPRAVHHEIRFYPDHPVLIELFAEAVSYLYQQSPTVTSEKSFFRVSLRSKPVCEDLLRGGRFGALDWRVPEGMPVEAKREWLRGFFDCEGYVCGKYVRVDSVNEDGLVQIQSLLHELGIETRRYQYRRKNLRWNVNHILCITRKDARQRFLKEIGFNHPVKQARLVASVAESG